MTVPVSTHTSPTLRSNGKWWALVGLSLAVMAVSLDSTVLSVALPTLSTVFHASESDLQWFTSGYLLVLAAGMLPAGLLGDRFGRKKVLVVALTLFGLGSAACAFSTTTAEFIAARMLLGLAGAGIIVMALAAFTVLFNDEERPRAIGVWAAANFLALPLGPILGGWLLTDYWWGWVFLINVPVAALGLLATVLLVPSSRASLSPGLDLVGILLSTAGLVALVYGFIRAGEYAWTDGGTLTAIAFGLVLLVAFVFYERWLGHRPGGKPLVDLGLFRLPSFTWGVILAALAGLAMVGTLFTLPQYFQGVLGADAMGSGLRLLPLIAGLIIGAIPAAWVANVIGPRFATALGFLLLTLGAALGTQTRVDSPEMFLAGWLALVGAGMGLVFATTSAAALSALDTNRSGVGSAVFQSVNKVGAPLGAAILGSVLHSVYQSSLNVVGLSLAAATAAQSSIFAGVALATQLGNAPLLASVRDAFVSGMSAALWVSAAIAAIGFVLAVTFMPGRRAAADRSKVTTVPSAAGG